MVPQSDRPRNRFPGVAPLHAPTPQDEDRPGCRRCRHLEGRRMWGTPDASRMRVCRKVLPAGGRGSMSDESVRWELFGTHSVRLQAGDHDDIAECVSRWRDGTVHTVRDIKNASRSQMVGHYDVALVRPLLKEVATLWHWSHNFRRGVEPYRRTQRPECSAPPRTRQYLGGKKEKGSIYS